MRPLGPPVVAGCKRGELGEAGEAEGLHREHEGGAAGLWSPGPAFGACLCWR
jgi:hypothetical protein